MSSPTTSPLLSFASARVGTPEPQPTSSMRGLSSSGSSRKAFLAYLLNRSETISIYLGIQIFGHRFTRAPQTAFFSVAIVVGCQLKNSSLGPFPCIACNHRQTSQHSSALLSARLCKTKQSPELQKSHSANVETLEPVQRRKA